MADYLDTLVETLDNMAKAYVGIHYMAAAALQQARDEIKRGDRRVSKEK